METKHCKRCGRDLPISKFSRDRKSKDGLAFYCKDCISEKGKIFRSTPEGIYQQLKGQINHTKKHKGQRDNRGFIRGVRKDLFCTQDEFVKWYKAQPKICGYCDLKESELPFSSDIFNKTIIRLTIDCKDNDKGYSIDNMVLSCGRCNFTKSDFFTYEQMLEIGKIIKISRGNVLKNHS